MIGLMGGTFNPIHYGHLLMCEGIREEFELEKVVFMPAKVPPHKEHAKIIQAYDRLKMVKLAIKGNPYFETSDLEMKREGSSYTIDTVKIYNEKYGRDNLGLIIGADSMVQFETWKEYREIFKRATILVASRPDTNENALKSSIIKFTSQFGARIFKYSGKAMDYSSTEIRRRVKEGLSIKYRVPPEVEGYIYNNQLYINGVAGGADGYQ